MPEERHPAVGCSPQCCASVDRCPGAPSEDERLDRAVPVAALALASAGFVCGLFGPTARISVPLYLLSYAFGAFAIGRPAWRSLANRELDFNVLMFVASLGALFLGEFSEAAFVLALGAFAEELESAGLDRAERALTDLAALTPDEALVLEGSATRPVPASEIRVGARIRVLPGSRVPLDGVVRAGDGDVDESLLTGESLPRRKVVGDAVLAGSLVGDGALDLEVTAAFHDTSFHRIADLAAEARAERPPLARTLHRFARVYTPLVVSVAILVAVGSAVAGRDVRAAIELSLVLLLISCPCALVLAAPIATASALANAARSGILVRGGMGLERAGAVSSFAFDKTGTLTAGVLSVVALHPEAGVSEGELLSRAAAVEAGSEHPIATAILARARADGHAIPEATGFRVLRGLGAEATSGGRLLAAGNLAFFQERRLASPAVLARYGELAGSGSTPVLVAEGDRFLGAIVLADAVRTEAVAALDRLRGAGIADFHILTGDHERSAREVGETLGIGSVSAGLLPAGKVDAVRALAAAGRRVAMVGDGVNDGPALSAASLGVAMGARGSALALESADLALLRDDLHGLPHVVLLARQVRALTIGNLSLALGAKIIVLGLALFGIRSLALAVVADTGVTLIVILNGLRALSFRS